MALLRRVVVTVGVNEHSGASQIARHTRRWRVVGLLLGGVAAVLLLALGQRVDALGRATALAPTVLGAGVLLGTIAGELTARPSVGIRRSAAVETRTLRAILPRGRAVVLAVSTALLVGALAIGAAWGSADDLGRAGRVLSERCTVVDPDLGAVLVGGSRGPWPGSFYALPLAVALLVLAGLVALALRAIVNRPRPELDSRGLDTMLRCWSVGNVLTAATVTVLGTLGPVALLMVGGAERDAVRRRRGPDRRGLDRCGRRTAGHRRRVRSARRARAHPDDPRRRPAPCRCRATPPRSGRRSDDPVHRHGRRARPDPALRAAAPPARRPHRVGRALARRPAAAGAPARRRPRPGRRHRRPHLPRARAGRLRPVPPGRRHPGRPGTARHRDPRAGAGGGGLGLPRPRPGAGGIRPRRPSKRSARATAHLEAPDGTASGRG